MKLTDAKLNKEITVISVDNCEYQNRLSALGFVSGCKLCPLENTNGTMLLDLQGCRYAMSKEIVDHINVED